MAEVNPTAIAPSPRELRAGLLDSVRLDLLGPVAHDELLFDYRVRDRYMLGMLATDGTVAVDPARADDTEAPDTDPRGGGDPDVEEGRQAARAMMFPSSMGLSFAVERDVTELSVQLSWGQYEKTDNPMAAVERPAWQRTNRFDRVWARTARVETAPVPLPQDDGDVTGVMFDGLHGPVAVAGTSRRSASTGFRLVTLFVHNRQAAPGSNQDEAWLFQPVLQVTVPDGRAVFAGRREAVGAPTVDPEVDADVEERAALDMQYRRRVEFARGHAVSVHAEPSPDDPTRTDRLTTTFLPTHEVAKTSPASPTDTPQLVGLITDMSQLAGMPADELREGLLPLADGYARWLSEQAASVASDQTMDGHEDATELALYRAGLVADAIREGIDLLVDGSDALAAFQFANDAMAQQRLRTDAVRARRDGDNRDLLTILDELAADTSAPGGENAHTRWRPFQLAFVLLNLAALTDPTHESRSGGAAPVDLLFFPTGGGKTEAYLGLVAVTFAMRRLQPAIGGLDASDGVAVVMRYTLRLLTAQQFERAAALVCATETIRRQDPGRWGRTPFRLGMWVGGSLTPNRSTEGASAAEALDRLRQGQKPYGGSPHQLEFCPWCGGDLDPRTDPRRMFAANDTGDDAAAMNPQERTLTYCSDDGCEFGVGTDEAVGEGIPVVTVDDEIYRLLPTFVIGTIDKFAQLPWNPNVRMLFGRVHDRCPTHSWRGPDKSYRSAECAADTGHPSVRTVPATQACSGSEGRLRPPDLVIQDEFHLITGPLGTLTGLYETAIDELSAWEHEGQMVRAKVVASTATIRRAGEQARSVFARDTRIFPPQVLDVADTFFARETPLDESAGRLYVGVCASGRRLKEAEARLFRTVMAAAQHQWDVAEAHLPAGAPNPADPWMTTVGYFSSIRELAGMYRIATDELQSRLRVIEHDRMDFLGRRFVRDTTTPDGKTTRLWWNLEPVELTSRVGATDLRAVLGQLFTRHDHRVVKSEHSKSGWAMRPSGVDLVLATNMISVGVDVSRLGMMVVVGQPKTTAEYIQASSRIGRDYDNAPGIVFNLASWARPRDLSHWEQFEHYHDTFYRHVETQSVTPFAPRALDRGATGVLVSLLRGEVDAWAPDRGLIDVAAQDRRPLLDAAVDVIRDRAVAAHALSSQVDAAQRAAERRRDDLIKRLTTATALYAWRARGEGARTDGLVTLLHGAEDANGRQPWIMPNSLRNTEPGINVLVDRGAVAPPEPNWNFAAKADDAEAPVTGSSTSDAADDEIGGEAEPATDDGLADGTWAGDAQ